MGITNFRKKILSFLFFSPLMLSAQPSPQFSSSEIRLALEKLNTIGSALYIAAHPDDENTRLLAYLANERKVRTGYLSLTRGDGGQNLIGGEQEELLGLIRTQELLEARRTDGAEQFFTRALDFGFSKNPEETFSIWGKDKILSDVVWVIRKFRPDVIITRFPEDSRAGHGHHTASAILAHEAFIAAADPKKFPEQLKHVRPWQAKRILWNTYSFGSINTTSEDQLKINVGIYNPLLGKGYGEIAAESRSKHKSQGFGTAKTRGQQREYFVHTAGTRAEADLFEGIDLSWKRIHGSKQIEKLLFSINKNFDYTNPSRSVEDLVKALQLVKQLEDDYWRIQKEKELKDLIAACAGLWFESYAPESFFAAGDNITIRHQVLNRSELPVVLKKISAGKSIVQVNKPLTQGILSDFKSTAAIDKITQPYWLDTAHPAGTFTVKNQLLIGKAENEAALDVVYTFEINGKELNFKRPLTYKYTDPVQGEVYQPLAVTPPVTASIAEKAYIFTNAEPQKIMLRMKNFTEGVSAVLKASVPAGWEVIPAQLPLNFDKKGEEQNVELMIRPGNQVSKGLLKLSIEIKDKEFSRGLKVIDYEHIPRQVLFPSAEAALANISLKKNAKNIAYLPGAGDLVPQALRQIGYQVTELAESDIQNGSLAAYDAVITGIRFYNVSQRARFLQPKLLEYVKNGGTLLVQYNTSGGLEMENIGPYPFRISRSRVTDEQAEAVFINPEAPVLNYPNKITDKDFQGWVQERGLYFLSDMDPRYKTILSMHDKGESPSQGSIITADYGKGKFVYTSLSFFRQLPAGVPGAYRLFVNLIEKNNKHGN